MRPTLYAFSISIAQARKISITEALPSKSSPGVQLRSEDEVFSEKCVQLVRQGFRVLDCNIIFYRRDAEMMAEISGQAQEGF